jgi:ankyrin repeat protein
MAIDTGDLAMVKTLIAAGIVVHDRYLLRIAQHCASDGTGAWKVNYWEQRSASDHPTIDSQIVDFQSDYSGVMRALIDAKADVFARFEGYTTLIFAAAKNNIDAVKSLLAAGADPNDRDPNGMPVLMDSSRSGKLGIVSALIAAGADVNYIYSEHTALDLAESPEIASALTEVGGKTWRDLMAEKYKLVLAVVDDDLEFIRKLMVDADEVEKEVALTIAVLDNHVATVKQFLASGVRTTVMYDESPLLSVASYRGFIEIVRELLGAGADVTAKDEHGKTALQWAAKGKHRDVVALLLAKATEQKKCKDKITK